MMRVVLAVAIVITAFGMIAGCRTDAPKPGEAPSPSEVVLHVPAMT